METLSLMGALETPKPTPSDICPPTGHTFSKKAPVLILLSLLKHSLMTTHSNMA